MDILLAEVVPYSKGGMPTSLNVRFKELNPETGEMQLRGETFPVTYTSPYWTGNEGGMVSFPQVGTEILICKVRGSGTYYYLQSVVDNASLSRTDKNLRRASGVPMKKTFMGERGSGLVINDEFSKDYQNIGVQLKSATGKKVTLNDSPQIDDVSITNGLGDYLKMMAKPINSLIGKVRSFVLRMKYDIDILSDEGRIHIENLPNADNINIVNNGGNPTILGVPTYDPQKGNINLQTEVNDINLFAKGPQGRIFIKCLNKATGVLNLIDLETAGLGSRISIKSGGNLDLEAMGDLNIKATGNVNIQGTQIHLNSLPIISKPEIDNYLNLGVEI